MSILVGIPSTFKIYLFSNNPTLNKSGMYCLVFPMDKNMNIDTISILYIYCNKCVPHGFLTVCLSVFHQSDVEFRNYSINQVHSAWFYSWSSFGSLQYWNWRDKSTSH